MTADLKVVVPPQETCAIIKPDAIRSRKSETILKIIKDTRGVKIETIFRITFTSEEIDLFYSEHKDAPYFPDLKIAMMSGPSLVLIIEGETAIAEVLQIKRQVREKLKATGGPFNLFHCSDGIETAMRETELVQEFSNWEYLLA